MKHGQSFKTMAITINGTGTLTGVSVGGLPDGIVDTDMLAASAVTAAKSSGSAKGITVAETWRTSGDFTSGSGSDTHPTNWEKDDHATAGSIGSGMSHSSGVFTFPETGIYLITYQGYARVSSSGSSSLSAVKIFAASDNSTYNTVAASYFNIPAVSTHNYNTAHATFIFDVQNTSNYKIKLGNYSSETVTWEGTSGYNLNCAMFVRLGDT